MISPSYPTGSVSSYHNHTVVIHFLENLTFGRLSSSFWCSSALNVLKNILHEEEMCQTGSHYLLRVCYWPISLPSGSWMKCKTCTPKQQTLILYHDGFVHLDSYTKTELKWIKSCFQSWWSKFNPWYPYKVGRSFGHQMCKWWHDISKVCLRGGFIVDRREGGARSIRKSPEQGEKVD